MILPTLLYSALLAPIIVPQVENTDPCFSSNDAMKSVLYESFIPIDALVFKIGTSRMSRGEVSEIVTIILEAKKNMLLKMGNVVKVFNLSEKINEQEPMKGLLEKRQALIRSDESFIFKELIKSKQDEILKCINNLKGKTMYDPRLDKQYRQSIDRIYEAIYENLDINETIHREREELYRDFRQDISNDEFKRAKISLSLGGSIFYLPDLINTIDKINLKEKNKFIRDWINLVFDLIERLATSVASKNFIDQKYLVKEFIKSSTETGPANYAFEARSSIIKAANLNMEQIKELSAKQTTENSRLLKSIDNMRDAPWIVKYNKQIKEDLITYLMTHQPEDKKRVLNHFKINISLNIIIKSFTEHLSIYIQILCFHMPIYLLFVTRARP